MSNKKTEWTLPNQLTKTAFRQMYPAPDFRVSVGVYEPGTSYSGTTRSGLVVSLEGEFEYRFEGSKFFLGSHQHAVLPAGDYEFLVLSERKAKVIKVWDLREFFDQNKS